MAKATKYLTPTLAKLVAEQIRAWYFDENRSAERVPDVIRLNDEEAVQRLMESLEAIGVDYLLLHYNKMVHYGVDENKQRCQSIFLSRLDQRARYPSTIPNGFSPKAFNP